MRSTISCCLLLLLAWPARAQSEEQIAALIRNLGSPKVRERRSAAVALGKMGGRALPAAKSLVQRLGDPDRSVRNAAVEALVSIGPKVFPELRAAFAHADSNIRVQAAVVAGRMGRNALDLVPDLIRLHADRSEDVRAAATWAIGVIRPLSRAAVAALIARLKDESPYPRQLAARGLANAGPDAMRALADAMGDQSRSVRQEVLRSLKSYGRKAAAVLERLLPHLTSKDESVARSVRELIAEWEAAIVPELVRLLKSKRTEQRRAAARMLVELGEQAASAAPALLAALGDEDPEVVRLVRRAIRGLGEQAVAALRRMAGSKDEKTRRRAVSLLREMDPDWAIGSVVVGRCSYTIPSSRTEMVRHRHLRAALVFAFKQAGFLVAADTAFPPPRVDHEFFSLEQLRARGSEKTIVVAIEVSKNRLEAVIHDPQEKEPKRIVVPPERTDLWALANNLVLDLARPRATRPTPALDLTGSIDKAFFAHQERLDLGFVRRLEEIRKLLARLDAGETDVMIPVRLAVLHGLHGSFASRTDELSCLNHWGRALFFADLASTHPESKGEIARLGRELQDLAGVFASGVRLEQPSGPALLAETRVVRVIEETPLDKVTTYPKVSNLFHFVALVRHKFFVKEAPNRRRAFAASRLPDGGLIWATPTGTTNSARFDAAMLVKSGVEWNTCETELKEVGAICEATAEVERALEALGRRGRSRNYWDLLDNQGAKRRRDSSHLDGDSVLTLAFLDVLDAEVRSKVPFTARHATSLHEIADELIRRYQDVVFVRRERFVDLGSHPTVKAIDSCLMRYGKHRFVTRDSFPRLSALGLVPTAFSVESEEVETRARGLLRAGQANEALDEILKLARILPFSDSLVSGTWAWNTDSILLEYFLRAGQLERGLATLADIRNRHFSAEYMRLIILAWKKDDFSFIPATFSWDRGTGSHRDYLSRIEYALRKRDFKTMVSVASSYHYSANTDIQVRKALGELLSGDRNDAAKWRSFDHHLGQAVSKKFTAIYLHHWLEILDEEFEDNPRWTAIRAKYRMEDWAALNRARAALNLGPAQDLREVVDSVASVSRSRFADKESYPLWAALELEHQAVARLVLARAGNFTDRAGERTVMPLVVALLEKTKAMHRHVGANTYPRWKMWEFMLPTFMVRFGGKPSDVAAFCSRIPNRKELFASKHIDRALTHATGAPPVFAAFLEDCLEADKEVVFLHQPMALKQDLDQLFSVAYREGSDTVGLDLALRAAQRDKSIVRLRHYFADRDAAAAWIRENAPDGRNRRRWLEEIEKPDPEVEKRRKARTQPLPAVPSLLEYLNPKKS